VKARSDQRIYDEYYRDTKHTIRRTSTLRDRRFFKNALLLSTI
jgi:hypothetical protein